jgi:hypothetical protein
MVDKEVIKKFKMTGEVSTEEYVVFILKNYILKGHTLEDYQEDLVFKYGFTGDYARALKESALDSIKEYVKEKEQSYETWEEEMKRKGLNK